MAAVGALLAASTCSSGAVAAAFVTENPVWSCQYAQTTWNWLNWRRALDSRGMPRNSERLQQIRERVEQIGRLLRGEERINFRAVLEPVEKDSIIAPVYDRAGRRVNTAFQRACAILAAERDDLLFEAFALDPKFRLPPGCPPPRAESKVYFPVDKYPHMNFAGLVLGPRGVTQKRIEERFRCRLLIRGRGARSRDAGDDALHARIEAVGADARQRVAACAKYLKEEILVPRRDEENALKLAQLRELAAMNGTLREDARIARLAAERAVRAAVAHRHEKEPQVDSLEQEMESFLQEVGVSVDADATHRSGDASAHDPSGVPALKFDQLGKTSPTSNISTEKRILESEAEASPQANSNQSVMRDARKRPRSASVQGDS